MTSVNRKVLWTAVAILAIAGIGVGLLLRGKPPSPQTDDEPPSAHVGPNLPDDRPKPSADERKPADAMSAEATEDGAERTEDDSDGKRPLTEKERREAEEEKAVDAFDGLTDKWLKPSVKGVSMQDVDAFVKSFRAVPKARQDECVHRALNLVPDENVMLLAGILMDKTADKEIVETVYNDILNRDEDVKKPILQQIFKDKSHPCWADTAWILDVTGELPKSK